MLRFPLLFFFILLSCNAVALPVVSFIEFTPIASVPHNYSFGISEIKVHEKIVYAISFKRGKDVFAITPENMIKGYYPNIEFTGLSINDNIIVLGGKEKNIANNKNMQKTQDIPWLFMFKVQENKISILDIITQASINEYTYSFEYNLPNILAPNTLIDIDKDKKPEIELDFYDTGVTLYAEIDNDKLNIDYSSPKYNEIFNMYDVMEEKDDYQFMQYLVYGTIATRLTKKQVEEMYISYIRESNYKLQQLITNMRRIKELSVLNNVSKYMVEYLLSDIEQNELFNKIANFTNKKEFKKRVLLLDEQIKLLKIDEIILNDCASYIGGYIDDKKFADLMTIISEPSYIDINTIVSNILILDDIIHKYGYKVVYLKAGI